MGSQYLSLEELRLKLHRSERGWLNYYKYKDVVSETALQKAEDDIRLCISECLSGVVA